MRGDIYEALAEYRNGNGEVYAQDQFGLWHQIADEHTCQIHPLPLFCASMASTWPCGCAPLHSLSLATGF
jgi:hypothetical protein